MKEFLKAEWPFLAVVLAVLVALCAFGGEQISCSLRISSTSQPTTND